MALSVELERMSGIDGRGAPCWHHCWSDGDDDNERERAAHRKRAVSFDLEQHRGTDTIQRQRKRDAGDPPTAVIQPRCENSRRQTVLLVPPSAMQMPISRVRRATP
jgi:hypothetical protein